MMNPNRIYFSASSQGYISIGGLSRADFDRIGGDLKERFYPADQNNLADRWHKKFLICDGNGAYLDLDFQTEEPPVQDSTEPTDNYDWSDPEQNPYLLTEGEHPDMKAARRMV